MNRLGKNIIINPQFQKRFLIFCSVAFLVSCISFFAGASYFFQQLNEIGIQMGLNPNHVFFKFVSNQKSNFNLIFYSCAGILFCLQIGIGLIFSHRISGPLYRFVNLLKEMKNIEDVKQIRSREGDFFPEVFESFDNVVSLVGNSKNEETKEDSIEKKVS